MALSIGLSPVAEGWEVQQIDRPEPWHNAPQCGGRTSLTECVHADGAQPGVGTWLPATQSDVLQSFAWVFLPGNEPATIRVSLTSVGLLAQ